MDWLLAAKVIFIFLAIFWTIVNTNLLLTNSVINWPNFLFQAIGVTGVIVIYWVI